MSVANMVLLAVKDVMKTLSPTKSLQEGLIGFDFKIGEARKNLMQISFSPLAAWPIFIILAIVYLDPTRFILSLQKVMSILFDPQSEARFFLLNGQISTMGTVAALFFILQWFVRKEFLWIAVVFYFMNQGEMHIHLALSGIIGIFLSRSFALVLMGLSLVGRTKQIWNWSSGLQMLASLIVSFCSLVLIDYLGRLQYFAGSLVENRFAFLLLVIFSFYLFHFIFLAIWGHFSFQKKADPSFVPVYFSSSAWLGQIRLSLVIENQLKIKVAETLKHHMSSLNQLTEMKDQSPGLRLGSLEETLNKELAYLQSSASRLTLE